MKDGHIDPSEERELVDLTDAEMAKPPHAKVRTPLYEAKVDPDIYFFGFDLDADEARGGTGRSDTDPPGWFFVLKERPGEPRFGLDDARGAGEPIVTVNDLAWSDAGTTPGASSRRGRPGDHLAHPTESRAGRSREAAAVRRRQEVVGAPISAARWAYLLYQAPVMVAVHAAELLKTATD